MTAGLLVYLAYGRRHSRLRQVLGGRPVHPQGRHRR
jgi:hypothetical protein